MPSITDWLMVAITAVYVVATIFICWANIRSAKATKEQIEESKRQFEESNRAFVTVSFEMVRSGLVTLRIQNIGKRIASDVNIHVSEQFLNNMAAGYGREHLEKLCSASFTLGIGQSLYVYIGSDLQLERMSRELLTIEISYADSTSKYNDRISVDIKQYFWVMMYESPTEDVYQELKKQTREMDKISRELHSISLDTQKGDDHA